MGETAITNEPTIMARLAELEQRCTTLTKITNDQALEIRRLKAIVGIPEEGALRAHN